MGKAKVLSNEGCGYYYIQLIRDTDGLEKRLDLIKQKVHALKDQLADIEHNVACARDEVQAATDDVNQAIQNQDWEALGEAEKELAAAQSKLGKWTQLQGEVEARLLSLEKNQARMQSELDRCQNLYGLATCADMTKDLSPETIVGTIEYGRQSSWAMGPGWHPIIQPGQNEGNAAYSEDRDGIVAPAIESTPASWLYNYIMEPPARTWRPLYRVGMITEISRDTNTCHVLLRYNQSRNTGRVDFPYMADSGGNLEGVEIDYMECTKGRPFTVGDLVVVEFRYTNGKYRPFVVGFRDGPYECGLPDGTWTLVYDGLGFGDYELDAGTYSCQTLGHNSATYSLTFQESVANEYGVWTYENRSLYYRYEKPGVTNTEREVRLVMSPADLTIKAYLRFDEVDLDNCSSLGWSDWVYVGLVQASTISNYLCSLVPNEVNEVYHRILVDTVTEHDSTSPPVSSADIVTGPGLQGDSVGARQKECAT